MIDWQWLSFEQLTRNQLYEILKVRQQVFAVEQNCVYQDADDLDRHAWHLLGWRGDSTGLELAAYARVIFPGGKYTEPSIGRVLTAASARGSGLGKELMRKAIQHSEREYPDTPIRISAQQYLQSFYTELGFETFSGPYDEDGIPHITMLKRPVNNN
jgi:ElaA protein